MISSNIISIIKKITILAGKKILEIKKKSIENIYFKKNFTPVTIADIESNKIIIKQLTKFFPGISIISEEGSKISKKRSDFYFLIDPLDGTKEFIKGLSEYTVNIALMKDNIPFLGFIYIPEKKEIFWNDYNYSYHEKNNKVKKIKVSNDCEKILRIELSRSHPDKITKCLLKKFKEKKLNYSGSSLKLCNLASGTSNFYPRFGQTMEWDIAAGHAILKRAGGEIFSTNFKNICYNKDQLINSSFLAIGSSKVPQLIKKTIKELENERIKK